MGMKVDEGFHEQVTTLESKFGDATAALAKGDLSGLHKALTTIVNVANVLLTVIGALNAAKVRK